MERLFGEGRLHDRKTPETPLTVGYELEVYRDWQVSGSEMTPGEWVIEGTLLADAQALAALTGRGDPFDLQMDDGRGLQVFTLDGTGRIVNVEGTTFTTPTSR